MTRLAQSMSIGSLGQAIELDLGRAYGADLIELHDQLERPATVISESPTAESTDQIKEILGA